MQAINDKLVRLMAQQQLSRAELARRLQVNRAVVTQELNDPDNNWRIDNLDRWARALGYRIEIKFVKLPKED